MRQVVLVQQGSGLASTSVIVVFGRSPSRDKVRDIMDMFKSSHSILHTTSSMMSPTESMMSPVESMMSPAESMM
jgi:hypothetical protein